MPMSTKFEMRGDPGVMRNYGRLLVDLAAVVPDGIVAFFVSYRYMDQIISKWHDMGILQVRGRGRRCAPGGGEMGREVEKTGRRGSTRRVSCFLGGE
jgi:Rad3-related DNA helicase